MLYAHSLYGHPLSDWEPLERHLSEVARYASVFASAFGSEQWGEKLGELHDIGKTRRSYQHHLLKENGFNDGECAAVEHSHSGVGACWAMETFGTRGLLLAYCLAGHHAGLPDYISLKRRCDDEKKILQEKEVFEWIAEHLSTVKQDNVLQPPWKFDPHSTSCSFWVRMLFSCLTDADVLCTEAFVNPRQSEERGRYPTLAKLAPTFFSHLDDLQHNSYMTEVNQVREEIRKVCEDAAEREQGMFSLTVPTGGGKTLSGTAFALRHALKHNLKRIIYVIPYTSIVEQTAAVLRDFFGDDAVVEHHSNLDPKIETPQARLAAENWDAPIIVTTDVQFFESLYSSRPGRCRKLHNISESVVILDEVQLLPPNLLWPCTEAMAQLVEHYRTTIVLSTATQPALAKKGPLSSIPVHEIIPDPIDLFRRLKRTNIELPEPSAERSSWEQVAEEMCHYQQVLCIVNTRADCRTLTELLGPDAVYLSTYLCGQHRSERIAMIKQKLHDGEALRVVSTQLIEAGVDIDFPIVFRAFTGLSSIAQAAGRCNREGRLSEPGRVVVFKPPKRAPIGQLRKAEDVLMNLLSSSNPLSPDDPNSYPRFFSQYYDSLNTTGENDFKKFLVQDCRKGCFQFQEASQAFRMIDDRSIPVIVRYGDNESLINTLRACGPSRSIMRRLQRYLVNVPSQHLKEMHDRGFVEELAPSGSGIFIQASQSIYDARFGLDVERQEEVGYFIV